MGMQSYTSVKVGYMSSKTGHRINHRTVDVIVHDGDFDRETYNLGDGDFSVVEESIVTIRIDDRIAATVFLTNPEVATSENEITVYVWPDVKKMPGSSDGRSFIAASERPRQLPVDIWRLTVEEYTRENYPEALNLSDDDYRLISGVRRYHCGCEVFVTVNGGYCAWVHGGEKFSANLGEVEDFVYNNYYAHLF